MRSSTKVELLIATHQNKCLGHFIIVLCNLHSYSDFTKTECQNTVRTYSLRCYLELREVPTQVDGIFSTNNDLTRIDGSYVRFVYIQNPVLRAQKFIL